MIVINYQNHTWGLHALSGVHAGFSDDGDLGPETPVFGVRRLQSPNSCTGCSLRERVSGNPYLKNFNACGKGKIKVGDFVGG